MAVQLLNETNVMALPIDDIKPNPYQQRKYFDFYSLNRLTESIKKYGVIQPVTVRLVNGKTYELVAGERRLRAARAAGLKTIPAVFIDADEEESSINEGFKVGFYRLIDIGQVFLDRTDQIPLRLMRV